MSFGLMELPGGGTLIEQRRKALAALLENRNAFAVGALEDLLTTAGITSEGVCAHPGALMIRRRLDDGRYLFVANQGTTAMAGWFPVATPAKSVAIMDPRP